MESPIKKLDLVENKENINSKAAPAEIIPIAPKIPELEMSKHAAAKNPPPETIKDDEADEPILRENASRFVLFPIKYHEVRMLTRLDSTRRVNNIPIGINLHFRALANLNV